MQGFHYNSTKYKYRGKAEILLTDTDSLAFKIGTENSCEDFNKNKESFDLSNDSKDSNYYQNSNNLVVGKMKGLSCGVAIWGFVGLKAKM